MSLRQLVAPTIRGLISLAKVAPEQIVLLLQNVVDVRRIDRLPTTPLRSALKFQFNAVSDKIVHALVARDLPFMGLTFR
jgi:hypothetical protein